MGVPGWPLTIHQDVNLYASVLEAGKEVTLDGIGKRRIFVQLISGELEVNGEKIAAGEALLAPSVTRRLIEAIATRPDREQVRAERLDVLTEREAEVVALVAKGLNNTEIGEALYVTGYGLIVAIPSVMLFNWQSGMIAKYEAGLANAGSELVDQLEAGAIGGGVSGDIDAPGAPAAAPAE